MAWVSWTQMLADWKTALARRDINSFFLASYENRNEMRTTYTKLGNIQEFTAYLEAKAAEESAGLSSGAIPFAVGGY